MKLFLSYQKAYWKEKRSGLLLFLLCVLLFSGIFYLYRLPLRAVFYPALLCLLLIFAFLLLSFRKWKKKQTDLDTLVQNLVAEEEQNLKKVNLAIEQEMPKADTLQEEAYQQLIAHLQEQLSIQEAVSEAKRQDMTDYYTLWVHQIKTPLASMQLSLQNEDSALSRKLTAELYRTEQYVEMALAYLRLQVGSTDYLFKRISLDALLQNSVKRFSTEFITKKLKLNYVPTEKEPVTDEKWLGFVIEQLLSNALKYTNHGSISLYLSSPDTLCIEDTGIGIAPEDLPRVFEKGYTGYNGRLDKKASGIGLYLCKQICKNLGMELTLESVIGKGTKVFLGLQQHKVTAD